MLTRENERGQVLPLWIFGILSMLVSLFFMLTYGSVIQWHVRAQSAADAAAQSILSLQTQQFNQMEMLLYASAVEEYRIRRLLNGMLLAVNGQGGCNGAGNCEATYESLATYYLESTQRYTNDVITFNRVAANINLTTATSDATALLAQLSSGNYCGTATGLDCAFTYNLVQMRARQNLEAVKMDALGILKPSFQHFTGAAGENPNLMAPAEVEVTVCASVTPWMNGFFGFSPQPFLAIGRSAAAAVMTEQDWMQPGQVVNPVTSGVFQPAELPAGSLGPQYNWYNVDFGGNDTTADAVDNVFISDILSDEFSVRMGWWNSIPEEPWMGQLNVTTTAGGCTVGT